MEEIFSSLSTHDIGMNKVPFVAARLQYVVQIYLPLVMSRSLRVSASYPYSIIAVCVTCSINILSFRREFICHLKTANNCNITQCQ